MSLEFTEKFHVGSSAGTYGSFIVGLRNRVKDGKRTSHGLPVLPLEETRATKFFDVVLTSDTQSLKLRFRRDNLYLIAYGRMNGENVQWHEFNDTGGLVRGSNTLPFSGNYQELTQRAGVRRDQLPLSKEKLKGAVGKLARIETSDADQAKSLIIIIEMVCESVRLKAICDSIIENYNRDDLQPPDRPHPNPHRRIEQLENLWSGLSTALFAHDRNPQTPVPNNIRNELEITGYPGIVKVLGILHQPRQRLAEVFDMRIMNINGEGEGRGQLYGTVTAVNGLQSDCIYKRAREDHESIEAGQHASLNGPSRAISASDDFTVDFNLMNKGAPSPNDQIARSRIAWNSNDQTNKYDELRTDTINSDYGSVALDYVVMSNAAEALVEVVLVNKDGEDPADVYGEIYAQTSSFPDKRIKLFGRESHDHVGVYLHSCVPLLRSALAVPVDASLTISASLGDNGRTSPDEEIANGTAQFKPAILQSASGLITGRHGKLEVRVSWI